MGHAGEAETADGWRYRMIYLEPDRLEAITGVRDWWFSEVVREELRRTEEERSRLLLAKATADYHVAASKSLILRAQT